MRERDRQVQDDRASRADELLERALARWLAALEQVGADAGGGAFSADDLIHRAERAKRNRETVLGHAPARPRSEV